MVVEAQYLFDKSSTGRAQYGINVRYISESFEEKVSKTKINGNSLGLGFFIYY
jgi:nitrous oxidase accessory protein NosD